MPSSRLPRSLGGLTSLVTGPHSHSKEQPDLSEQLQPPTRNQEPKRSERHSTPRSPWQASCTPSYSPLPSLLWAKSAADDGLTTTDPLKSSTPVSDTHEDNYEDKEVHNCEGERALDNKTVTEVEDEYDNDQRRSTGFEVHLPPQSKACLSHEFAVGVPETLSWCSAWLIVSVEIIGAGILVMPFVFKLTSVVVGLAIITIMGIMSLTSAHLVAQCAKVYRRATLEGLGEAIISQNYHLRFIVVTLAPSVSYACAITSYVLIATDLSVDTLSRWVIGEVNRTVVSGCLCVGLVVLCLPRSINGVKWLSWIAFTGLGIVFVVVIIESIRGVWVLKSHTLGYENTSLTASSQVSNSFHVLILDVNMANVLSAIPIMLTAYVCHSNIPQLYCEMKRSVKTHELSVLASGFCTAMFIYFLVGVVPLLCFGKAVKDNVLLSLFRFYGPTHPDSAHSLLSYPSSIDEMGLTLTYMILALAIAVKTPLIAMPLRQSLLSIIAPTTSLASSSNLINLIATSLPIVCACIASLAIPRLHTLLSLTGAVSGNLAVFVVPGLLAWCGLGKSATDGDAEKWVRWQAAAVLSFGVLGSVGSLMIMVVNADFK
eukprot:GHVN01041366.1.p1 GENE.GHVN01041366.1~~GHVN01041366.1.p1  ORF type:complete len:599 (+),score=110.61 GHVN01041366.1:227-2023(+)